MSETLDSTQANIFIQSKEIGGMQFSQDCDLKVEYKNGMKEGVGWVFSEKKTKLARLSFHEDQLDGLCVFYTYEGQKKKECMYENGIQRGWGREFCDGRAVYTGIYENGKRKSELLEYDDDKEQYKEVMNNQVISICRFNENHKLNGICYFYENESCFDVVLYEDGIKKWLKQSIQEENMKEYNENGQILYFGHYQGNVKNGFTRYGIGQVYIYQNNIVHKIEQYDSSLIVGTILIENDCMKEYQGEELVYCGNYITINDQYIRNSIGTVYTDSKYFYKSIFLNGQEKQRIMEIVENTMFEFDENNHIVYKGEYDNECKRKGKGQLFEYENEQLIRVYECIDGIKQKKSIDFIQKRMIEYDNDGLIQYKGGYCGTIRIGFQRDGDGDLFENDMIVYSGEWFSGIKEGEGCYYRNGDLYYKGEWIENKPNGDGQYMNSEGDVVYEGCWKNGYCHILEEQWLYYEDGKYYGLHTNGVRKYDGEWKDGKPEGKGIYYDKEGNKKYEGEWHNGRIEIEKGIWFDSVDELMVVKNQQGFLLKGRMENGKFEGEGKVVYQNQVLFEGEWNNGLLSLNDYCYIEIENTNVYIHSLEYTGFWKCKQEMVRREIVIPTEPIKCTIHSMMKLKSISRTISELNITGGCNSSMFQFHISNYPFLESITVTGNSLQNIDNLYISDNAQLHSIVIGDNVFDWNNIPCMNVSNISITNLPSLSKLEFGYYSFESTILCCFDNLPNLKEFTTGSFSFQTIKDLKLIDLPSLEIVSFGSESFHEVKTVSLKNLPMLLSFSSVNGFYMTSSVVIKNIPNLKELMITDCFRQVKDPVIINASMFHDYLFFKNEVIYSFNELIAIEKTITCLIIGHNCCSKANKFRMKNYNNLTLIDIGDRSLQNVNSVVLSNLPQLIQFKVGEESFYDTKSLTMSDLPKLKIIQFKDESFDYTTDVTLTSIEYYAYYKEIDVPFKKGEYNKELYYESPFTHLSSSRVSSDSVSKKLQKKIITNLDN